MSESSTDRARAARKPSLRPASWARSCTGQVGQAIADFNMVEPATKVDGLPVGRQVTATRCSTSCSQLQARAGPTSSSSPSTSTRSSPAFRPTCCSRYLRAVGVPFHIEDQDTY